MDIYFNILSKKNEKFNNENNETGRRIIAYFKIFLYFY